MDGSEGWLASIFADAERNNWCTRAYCTTCGSDQFRRSYWTAAAARAGVAIRDADRAPIPNLLAGLGPDERARVAEALMAGVRELPSHRCHDSAFDMVVSDLDPLFVRHGVARNLDAELQGTPAGDSLEHKRAWIAERNRKESERREYESPEAAARRRAEKREQRVRAHAARREASRQRSRERAERLADLADLSPGERLRRFASDTGLTLDRQSFVHIGATPSDLLELNDQEAAALIRRIDRRKGPWGRIRRLLMERTSD
jgi:hypothetical protein